MWIRAFILLGIPAGGKNLTTQNSIFTEFGMLEWTEPREAHSPLTMFSMPGVLWIPMAEPWLVQRNSPAMWPGTITSITTLPLMRIILRFMPRTAMPILQSIWERERILRQMPHIWKIRLIELMWEFPRIQASPIFLSACPMRKTYNMPTPIIIPSYMPCYISIPCKSWRMQRTEALIWLHRAYPLRTKFIIRKFGRMGT